MSKSSSRKYITILILLITAGLAAAAIYIGYRLSREEGTEAPEETEAAELDSAWRKVNTGGTCTWENGCKCTIQGGCTLVWYDCPEIYQIIEESGLPNPAPICHTNKHVAGDVDYDPDKYHSIISIIGQSTACKYIQIDVYKKGETSGNNSWILMYWNPEKPCYAGCGDRECSNTETNLNRCEKAETGSTYRSCKTGAVVDDCRIDCTWCGDGIIQGARGEECDPGVSGGDSTCNADCTKIVIPQLVTCGEECTEDSECEDDGTVCNGDTITDDRYPDGTCILEMCTEEDASCTDDGCDLVYPEPEPEPEVLPETAIIDEQNDIVLIGVISVLSGLLLLKFNFFKMLRRTSANIARRLQTGVFAYLTAPVSSKAQTELTDRKKEEFEKEISK